MTTSDTSVQDPLQQLGEVLPNALGWMFLIMAILHVVGGLAALVGAARFAFKKEEKDAKDMVRFGAVLTGIGVVSFIPSAIAFDYVAVFGALGSAVSAAAAVAPSPGAQGIIIAVSLTIIAMSMLYDRVGGSNVKR